MAKSSLSAAPKDAKISHTGHTTSGNFGSDPNAQAKNRGSVRKLSH